MSITVTAAASGATAGSGGAGQTLSLPAYNQVAGNCIVITLETDYASSATVVVVISDTAGNIYLPVFPGINTGVPEPASTNIVADMWYCPNCKGNAANVVTMTYVGGTNGFSSALYQDIAGLSTTPLDATSSGVFTVANVTNPAVTAFSTNAANEVIITSAFSVSGYYLTNTPNPGILDGTSGQGGVQQAVAHNIVSSIQIGITPGWTTSSTKSIVLAASFKAASNLAGGGSKNVVIDLSPTGTGSETGPNQIITSKTSVMGTGGGTKIIG